MIENISKAEFVNFLLEKKHDISPKKSPILESHASDLKLPEFFNSFSSDFTEEEIRKFLVDLEEYIPTISEDKDDKIGDLVFGILFSCAIFTKLVKKKDFKHKVAADFYKAHFNDNKKFMMEFNNQDKGKVNISAPKNIVTRFPPEANGYLHIGHVKAALLNAYMAKEGKLILRFDDTNPEKEKEEYEEAIVEDLKLLNIKPDQCVRSSDHFDKLYEYAIILIKKGLAYMDNTDQETMRNERMEGIDSKNRNANPERSLFLFEALNKKYKSEDEEIKGFSVSRMTVGDLRKYCLRAKIDMQNVNKAMRDPVIYRYKGIDHIVQKDKYQIYPTYDFSCPVVDSIDGVTLCLRTNEYRDRNVQYHWFIEKLEMANKPKIHDFSRLSFENTVLSKRKIKFYVDNGFVEGWNDPRVATLRGIKRLGMDMDALKDYIIKQGSSQKSATISWDKIWSVNKKMIDNKSARYSAVPKDGAVVCDIFKKDHDYKTAKVDDLTVKMEKILRFKKNEALGYKELAKSSKILLSQDDARVLKENEEFTLMNWGNMIVREIISKDGVISKIILSENLEGDFKTTKNKLSWIEKSTAVEFKAFEYGNLQNDTETDDLEEKFNKNSKIEEVWLGEKGILDTKAEEYIQIERIGFYICDKKGEFILVPYTKQKRTNKD